MSSTLLAIGWTPAAPQGAYHIQIHNQQPHILGSVPDLVLSRSERSLLQKVRKLRMAKQGGFHDAFWELRRAYETRLKELQEGGALAPGILAAVDRRGRRHALPAGASLACDCHPQRAIFGLCHRFWAAPWLLRAGWDVRVEGVRWGALRHQPQQRTEDQWRGHLQDLVLAGFRVEQHRVPIVSPLYTWWRIGAQIFKGEQEVGRVWGEAQLSEAAHDRAVWALRVWASNQGFAQ